MRTIIEDIWVNIKKEMVDYGKEEGCSVVEMECASLAIDLAMEGMMEV